MKKLITWSILSAILMIGCPFFAVEFAGEAGMAICFLLFFIVNPLFSAVCGVFAGRDTKHLWLLPITISGLFLMGVWMFFEIGEPAFLMYAGCYLVIGSVSMAISHFVSKRKVG